ncbi:MAG: A24 family peptidase [Gammaproteobacteria bacterium]|nr:A24 family peptidase [Gammaproteobacteria bacterium]
MYVIEYLRENPDLFLIFVALLGLALGSFLNVVVYRLPQMMERDWRSQCDELLGRRQDPETTDSRFNLISPRSSCPSCGHRIRAVENIPVLSYLFLRGRCAACDWRIPLRYPAVEALTAVLSMAVAWRFGVSVETVAGLFLTWGLIALCFIDLDTQLLPDAITLPVLWAGLAFNLFHVHAPLWDAVVGAICGYGILWIVYQAFRLLTGKEGMGFGDFKLLAALGAWLGWQQLPLIILLSSVLGAMVGLALMLAKGHRRDVPIPFGPYLATAGWIAMIWGDEIIGAYLSYGTPSG